MSKKRKIKALLWKLFYMIFNGAVGIGAGVCAIIYLRSTFADIFDSSTGLLLIIGLFLVIYVASYLQVIIHESGHLVFGLMSGYRFGSFRIASFIWVKDQGKIKFKRMKIAGTGGQCLMSPPEMVDGKFPVVLYNFGGALMNLIFAALFIGLFFAFKSIPILPPQLPLRGYEYCRHASEEADRSSRRNHWSSPLARSPYCKLSDAPESHLRH